MTKKSSKKILYIITKSVWGGASKYVYDLATGLPKDEFEIFVAAGPVKENGASGNGSLAQKIKETNIPYFNIKNFQRDVNVLKEFLAGVEILKLLFKIKPNIIHASSSKAAGIVSITAFIYSFCYKLLNTNYQILKIFTVHGWGFHENRPKKQIFLIKLFSKITCLFYNKIICVSEFDRQSALKNKIVSAKKLITIHNGIKLEDYNFLSKEQAREQLGSRAPKLNPGVLWIGTIGENTKNKGHKYLKKAFKDAIIISNLPKGSNYLKAFDIFVLPSIKEGLPYILLEAGLAQLPVIATKVGGVPEIIKHPSVGAGQATGLLIKPSSSQELQKNIKQLSNNIELRNELAFNLWQKVNREFAFEKMLSATIATYHQNSKTSEKY